MGFWIFMLLMNLLIPLSMIGFGCYFIKHAPREINSVFGYRTSMSMKNRETWNFAHHHCGVLWWKIGWFLLIASVIAMLTAVEKSENTVSILGGVVSAVQVVFLIGSIIPTERALRKAFDENGNPKG